MSTGSVRKPSGIALWRSKSPSPPQSQSPVDSLGPSIVAAKTIAAAGECAPFPYVKGVFGTAIVVLEAIQKAKKPQDDLKDLCGNIMQIMHIVQGHLLSQKQTDTSKLEILCKDLESVLQGVLAALAKFQNQPKKGFRERFTIRSESFGDRINGYKGKIQELRLNFMLMAYIDTDSQLHTLGDTLIVDAPHRDQFTNNCPPASGTFLGRQAILEKMRQYFNQDMQKQHVYVLYGLGGVGKTQIALRFIELSTSCFSDIFLIDTSTVETTNAGLKNIAVTKNMGTTSEEAKQWLNSNKDWLLFFNNADDPKIDLRDYLPPYTHGNIIITSRNSGVCVYATGHGTYSRVTDMEEAEALELLLKSALQDHTVDNTNIARSIVKELHCLPLAIIQTGAFIAKSGNLGDYLDLYLENKTRLLIEQPVDSQDDYEWTVYTTWQISFEQLSPLAARLLQLCSLLHYEGISEDIFKSASHYTFPAQGPSKEDLEEPVKFLSQFLSTTGTWDELKFQDTTNEIQSYSLMNFDPVKKTFSMHPLVHDWFREIIISQATHHFCMLGIVGMCIAEIPYPDMQYGNLGLQFHLDSLVQEHKEMVPDFGVQYALVYRDAGNHEKAAKFPTLAGKLVGENQRNTLLAIEQLEDAKQLESAVLKKQSQLCGADHSDTMQAAPSLGVTDRSLAQFDDSKKLESVLDKHSQLIEDDNPEAIARVGATYRDLGQFEEAKNLFQGVLEKRSQLYGYDNYHTLLAMANLAGAYQSLKQFNKAKKLEQVVLDKWVQLFGDDHPYTQQFMSNLGVTYHFLNQFEEARKLQQPVLEKRIQLFGDDHPDTLQAMANLGTTFRNLSQFDEAKKLEHVVLKKRKLLFGDDHPDTLNAMANLGRTFWSMKQFDEAKTLQQAVLKKRKVLFGDDHPDTLYAMANLGLTFGSMKQFNEAKTLDHVVLKKQSLLFGDDHPDTLLAMANLGTTYYFLSQFDEAKNLFQSALEKCSQLYGYEHSHTLLAMANLAVAYKSLKQFDKAKELEQAVFDKRSQLFGHDNPYTIHTMACLGATYQGFHQFEEAKKLRQAVLDKRIQLLGDDHPNTLRAMAKLGATYRSLKQFDEAKKLEQVVLRTRNSFYGDEHPDTLEAMANLGATYQDMKEFEKAKKLELVVLEKQTRLFGDDHPDTLKAMANLSVTYRSLKQFEEAKNLEQVVLKKRSQLFGEDHPDTLQAISNLGTTYRDMKQFEEAKKLELAVLEKCTHVFGDDHFETLQAMANLGVTNRCLGQFEEAKKLEVIVLEKWTQLFGDDHPDTLQAMANLGATYHCLSQFEEAKKLKKAVLTKCKALYGDHHLDTLSAMTSLLCTYRQIGNGMDLDTLEELVKNNENSPVSPSVMKT